MCPHRRPHPTGAPRHRHSLSIRDALFRTRPRDASSFWLVLLVAQSPSVPSPAPAPVPMASPAAQQHFSTDTAQQHDVMGCSIAVQHGARPVPSFIGILPCGLPSEDCAQCLPYYLDLPILLHMECPAMMLAQRCDARGSAQRYAMPSLFPWPPAASTPFHQIRTT